MDKDNIIGSNQHTINIILAFAIFILTLILGSCLRNEALLRQEIRNMDNKCECKKEIIIEKVPTDDTPRLMPLINFNS